MSRRALASRFWSGLKWLVVILSIASVMDGVLALNCPPNIARCILVQGDKDADGFYLKAVAFNAYATGYSYNEFYAYIGFGDPDFDGVDIDDIDGQRIEVEWKDPDCPTPGAPQIPAGIPCTVVKTNKVSGPYDVTFHNCCGSASSGSQ